jgi:hypothetical protein
LSHHLTPISRGRSSDWLAGLTVGGASGFLLVILPTLGAVVVLTFLVLVARARGRAAPLGGLLIALPVVWLLLIGRATLACDLCDVSDLTGWIIVAVSMLALGVALSITAARRGSPAASH